MTVPPGVFNSDPFTYSLQYRSCFPYLALVSEEASALESAPVKLRLPVFTCPISSLGAVVCPVSSLLHLQEKLMIF